MKKIISTLLVLANVAAYSQCNQLVWSDEFNGNSIDLTKWAFQNGDGCPSLCGWGNGELQTYTNNAKNTSVANGILTMTAVKETVGGSSFTGSKLRTLGLHAWKYGRFEARMKMPLGRGLWPAFWMLSTNNQWPTTGEIDIMEYRGDKPTQTNATLHYGLPSPNNRNDGSVYNYTQNLSDAFHVYAAEWDENQIKWYFDNVLIKTETKTPNSLNPASNSTNVWPWNTEFYMILNLAVGGLYTGSPTVSQVELTKPTFEVDYVRVYSGTGSNPALTPPAIVGSSRMFSGETKSFSVQQIIGATYNWTVSGGMASIIGSSNGNTVLVKNTSESIFNLILTITTPATSQCPSQSVQSSLAVSTFNNNCTFSFNNFETNGNEATTIAETNGTSVIQNNPFSSVTNNSQKVLKYVRSPNQYDLIFLDNTLLKNGSEYENGSFVFELDIYSPKPAGTPIEIQIGSSSTWAAAWPTGRHSVYKALTTKTNQWETLRFVLSQTADPNRAQFDTKVDRLLVLLNPNSTASDTYYLDNLKRISISNTTCLLTGFEDFDSYLSTKISVFPSPAKDVITIKGLRENETITILHLDGTILLETQSHRIDLSSFSSGIYFIKVENQRVKFIKE